MHWSSKATPSGPLPPEEPVQGEGIIVARSGVLEVELRGGFRRMFMISIGASESGIRR